MAGGVFFPNGKNTPPDPLETTKGRASALPLETFPEFTGDFGETGAGASLRVVTKDVET